jgi:DNA primase
MIMDFSSIDFVDLLSRIGLSNAHITAGGVEINYSCHRGEHSHGDESPSAYLNSTSALFMCHGCGFHGSVAVLVADVQQVSRATAERFLRDTYGLEFDEPIDGSFLAEIEARLRPVAPPSPVARPPESWLSSVRLDWYTDNLEPYQQYMLNRGLSRETLTEWEIGYDYLSNRITIPVRALDGSLFGIKGRDWENSHPAKYLILGDRPGSDRLRYGFGTYEITEVVFGLHRARDVRWIVLHEGELNVKALWQMGIPRPTALGTSRMSERQRRLIVDEAELVLVFLDAGAEDHAREIAWQLEPYVRVKIVEPLDVDPCDALRFGRQDEVLRAIDGARSSIALANTFG